MIFEPGGKKKHLFLDISSTNISTPFLPFYHCVETRSIKFWLLSEPLPHLRFKLFVISEKFATFLVPVVGRFTRQTFPTVNRKHLIMNTLNIESFAHKKRTTGLCSSVLHSSSTVAILTPKPNL
jgi:hypothetical protein